MQPCFNGYGARRAEWKARSNEIDAILVEGAERARTVARETLKDVRNAMKIHY
jgi:hypothetical protein